MNFDEVINRRVSESYKWREYPEDVLPLFVADMDFRSPEPVARALRAYIDDGIFGYPRGLHTHDRAQAVAVCLLLFIPSLIQTQSYQNAGGPGSARSLWTFCRRKATSKNQ